MTAEKVGKSNGTDSEEQLHAVVAGMLDVVDAGLNPESIKISMELLDAGIKPRALAKVIKLLQKDARSKK
ncbi:hypothetical protein KR093_007772 [Drosophila rubida]|uniref:Mitotic-spindle organizing protein 1 n=1 Tax=Drosophila rubida TaxID=30044 RepID=A0AAD4PJA3_9MUSC|nr:hypothetical protein KR093_007772 [Drosophila rubida]